MGVDISTYRIRIGMFRGSMVGSRRKEQLIEYQVPILFLVVLTMSTLALLIVCGDIEVNPGPPSDTSSCRRYCAACEKCSSNHCVSYFRFPLDRLIIVIILLFIFKYRKTLIFD
jgi:hypothetical protein